MIEEQIQQAVEVLKKGGIILYPTDTVWGIGCDAANDKAVEKILKLKKSEDKKSMLVLVDKLDNVSRYVSKVPDVAWQLFEVSESPLTLILPGGCAVSDNLLPQERTIAIRVPKDDFLSKLLRRFPRALVSTSANISGEDTPTKFRDIAQEICQGVDFIFAPECESRTATHKASSIISVSEGGVIKIIRE
ncbi:MAG: L-threonylcarbamoyladenylate synthase [Rikenellaceae bacterium]